MARQLTERQQKFLSILFDEAGGDVVTAKKLAGYSDATSTTEVVNSMKEEILSTGEVVGMSELNQSYSMVKILDSCKKVS